MNKVKSVLIALLSLAVILTFAVSCSGDVEEESDELVNVSFSDLVDSSSRGLETGNETANKIENLYWAYIAIKVRGNYTTGQSERDSAWEDAGDDNGKVRDGYVLKAVKSGPATGLDGEVGPFSVGEWRFKLYGFEKYNAATGEYENIIYQGTCGETWYGATKVGTAIKWQKPVDPTDPTGAQEPVTDDTITIDKKTTGTATQKIVFNLSGASTGLATIAFGNLTLKVPNNQTFFEYGEGGRADVVVPKLKVVALDVTEGHGQAEVIAVGMTELKATGTDDPKSLLPGTEVALSKMRYVLGADGDIAKHTVTGVTPDPYIYRFAAGLHKIMIITGYMDDYTNGKSSWDGSTANYKYTTTTGDVYTTDPGVVFTDLVNKNGGKNIFVQYFNNSATDANGEADGNYAVVGNIVEFPVQLIAGVKTTLLGDLNDLAVAKGQTEDVEFDKAVAKITWTSAAVNPFGEDASAASETARPGNFGKSFTLFTDFADAVTAYDKHYTRISADKPYIELLSDIESGTVTYSVNASAINTAGGVAVLTGEKFVDNVVVDSTMSLRLMPKFVKGVAPAADTYPEGLFTFKAVGSNATVENFNYSIAGKTAWIYTEDAADAGSETLEITIDGTDARAASTADPKTSINVYHSGEASVVTLVDVDNTNAAGKGYMLGTRASTGAGDGVVTSVKTLTVTKGRVDIGGRATVHCLISNGQTAATGSVPCDVVLKAREDAVVQSYGYDASATPSSTTATMYRTWDDTNKKSVDVWTYASAEDTNATDKGGFRALTLCPNGATSDGTAVADGYWAYGIEGLPVQLPEFETLTAWKVPGYDATSTANQFCFMHWSTNGDPQFPDEDATDEEAVEAWGVRFADGDYVVPGIDPEDGEVDDDPVELAALWARPIGGRIFLANSIDRDKYHFFGLADGSVNEITGWYDKTGDAQISALSGAYYYTSTEPDKVYVAYAKYPAAGTSGTPVTSVTPIVTFFSTGTAGTDSYKYKFAWDEAVLETTSATPTIKSITTDSAVGSGKTNTTAAITDTSAAATDSVLLWSAVKVDSTTGTPVQQVKSLFDATITGDWFVGSREEYNELRKIIPVEFDSWDIWTSEQGATASTYEYTGTDTGVASPITYYKHAVYWNAYKGTTGGWDEAEKSTAKYFIPIRTLPVTEVTP